VVACISPAARCQGEDTHTHTQTVSEWKNSLQICERNCTRLKNGQQRSNGGPDWGTYYNCKRYDFKFHDSKYQVTFLIAKKSVLYCCGTVQRIRDA
jgi:hypothetical protein